VLLGAAAGCCCWVLLGGAGWCCWVVLLLSAAGHILGAADHILGATHLLTISHFHQGEEEERRRREKWRGGGQELHRGFHL